MKLFTFLLSCLVLISIGCDNGKNVEKEELISTDVINNPASATNEEIDVDDHDLPILTFDHYKHNFGEVKDGDVVDHSFKFTNTGKTPLIITDVKASCGCTVPFFPKDPIPPGEQDIIKISFDSKGKIGLQRKTITVFANSFPNKAKLHFTADVIPKN